MITTIINLSSFMPLKNDGTSSNVLVNANYGFEIQKKIKLKNIIKYSDKIVFKISKNILYINPSFWDGLLKDFTKKIELSEWEKIFSIQTEGDYDIFEKSYHEFLMRSFRNRLPRYLNFIYVEKKT